MAVEPTQPDLRHVWVRGHNDYAPVQPGLVISWQYSPVHKAQELRVPPGLRKHRLGADHWAKAQGLRNVSGCVSHFFSGTGPGRFAPTDVFGWVAAGARLVGGCCRVGPADIAAMRAALAS